MRFIVEAFSRIWQPLVQGGFAAFSAILLCVVVWLVYQQQQHFYTMYEYQALHLQTMNNLTGAIDRNTEAVRALTNVNQTVVRQTVEE